MSARNNNGATPEKTKGITCGCRRNAGFRKGDDKGSCGRPSGPADCAGEDRRRRLLVFLKGHTDGITVGKYRGGWRRWKRMEKVLAYVQEMMPEYPVEQIDVFLRQYSDSESSPEE